MVRGCFPILERMNGQQMTCVEASNVLSAAIWLEPGEEHTMRADISIVPE